MIRTILIVVMSAVALMGAGCYGAKPAAPPSGAAVPTPEIETTGLAEGTVVSIGPSGFNPNILTVKNGTTVIFINEDTGASHWVASDPNPAHTDYPGFDAGSPIQPGASFSFTFDRVGSWGYHDHLNPSHTATIVVTE